MWDDDERRSAGTELTRERVGQALHHERIVFPNRARAAEEHDIRRIGTTQSGTHVRASHARTEREERIEMRRPGDANRACGDVVDLGRLLCEGFVPREEHIRKYVRRALARQIIPNVRANNLCDATCAAGVPLSA